jgi:prephenate dehydrogenase
MKIAIIGGSGKMGKWFAGFLRKEGKDIVITGRDAAKLRQAGRELDVKTLSDNKAAVKGTDYIIVSVPVDSFEEVVREVAPYIKPGQTLIDVTSVKTLPMEVMHRYIKGAGVLGAHPLFGPGAGSIARQNFILTPTDDTELELAQKVTQYLEARDARVTIMSPQEHDETMSLVLGLSHFIAIVSADALLSSGKLKPLESISSTTYKVLLTLVESVLSEDPALYASLQMSLPDVTRFEKLFVDKASDWAKLVSGKDRQEFIRRMTGLKGKMEQFDPHFVKAYENMYRIVEGL